MRVLGLEDRDALGARPVLGVHDGLLEAAHVVGPGAGLAGHLDRVVVAAPAEDVLVRLQRQENKIGVHIH